MNLSDIKRIETGPRMSQAVIANGIVWLAGQVGEPGASVADQTRVVLEQVDRLLAEAGTDKTRIVSAQIWLADMADFAEMNAVWDQWVPQGHTPARATGSCRTPTRTTGSCRTPARSSSCSRRSARGRASTSSATAPARGSTRGHDRAGANSRRRSCPSTAD